MPIKAIFYLGFMAYSMPIANMKTQYVYPTRMASFVKPISYIT